MVHRKPWTFRIGVLAFGAVAFLAATGRTIGGDARPAAPPPAAQAGTGAPVVLDATVRP